MALFCPINFPRSGVEVVEIDSLGAVVQVPWLFWGEFHYLLHVSEG